MRMWTEPILVDDIGPRCRHFPKHSSAFHWNMPIETDHNKRRPLKKGQRPKKKDHSLKRALKKAQRLKDEHLPLFFWAKWVLQVVGARKGHEAGSCAGAQEVYNGKWRIPGELWDDRAFDDRARARRKGHEVQVQLPRCSREKVLAVHSQGDGQGKLLGLRQAKGKPVHARWGHRGVSREGKPEGYL